MKAEFRKQIKFTDELSAPHDKTLIYFKKGKTDGVIISYYYPGIGSGFKAIGDQLIKMKSQNRRGVLYDVAMAKEFKSLKTAKAWMEKHGYSEVPARKVKGRTA